MKLSEIIARGKTRRTIAPKINTITCGDCLEVMQGIPDKSIDMILCDLPYGTTQCKWDTVIPFASLWEQYNRIIKPRGAIVLNASQPFTSALVMSNTKGFKYCWVWNKKQGGNPLNAKRQPLRINEDVVVFNSSRYNPQMRQGKMRKKGGITKQPETVGRVNLGYTSFNDLYYPTSIIEVPNCANKKDRVHPTQKPVALFEYLILTYTEEGETVLDNCIGSGTTAIACINTGRNYIGIEKEEKYCKIAEERTSWARKARAAEPVETKPNSTHAPTR